MRTLLANPIPPVLAGVRSPTGAIWYVPRALRHGPFLVQRRYVGAGNYHYTGSTADNFLSIIQERVEPVLVPYLNPGAVQAAGLEIASIMAWSAQHPGEIFSHPTYASLCLRWGDNAHGYKVEDYPQDLTPDTTTITFTPHTCWLTGCTYYQVGDEIGKEVFEALAAQAGLQPHEQELGLEGNWPNWYLLDMGLAERALIPLGLRMKVACRHLYYGTWIHSGEAGEIQWLSMETTAEEALAYYNRLPEQSDTTQYGCTAMWGYTIGLPSQDSEWICASEKQVSAAYAADLWHGRVAPYPTPAAAVRQLYWCEVAPVEGPVPQRIPLLRDYLNATRLSRWQLRQQLEWSAEKLARVEQHPWELTLLELHQLASVLEIGEVKLSADVRHELRAWQAEQRLLGGGEKSLARKNAQLSVAT